VEVKRPCIFWLPMTKFDTLVVEFNRSGLGKPHRRRSVYVAMADTAKLSFRPLRASSSGKDDHSAAAHCSGS